NAIQRWLDKDGKDTTLDAELGLTRGKGKNPAYKDRLLSERNHELMEACLRLTLLGATQEQAAEMVSARMEATPGWNKSRWKLPALQPGTLVSMLQRMEGDERRLIEDFAACWNERPERVARFLATFPIDAAPAFKKAERKSAISICSKKRR